MNMIAATLCIIGIALWITVIAMLSNSPSKWKFCYILFPSSYHKPKLRKRTGEHIIMWVQVPTHISHCNYVIPICLVGFVHYHVQYNDAYEEFCDHLLKIAPISPLHYGGCIRESIDYVGMVPTRYIYNT